MVDKELAKMRAIRPGLPGMVARELLHLSPADRTRPAEGVSRAVDELFRMLRDRAGAAEAAASEQRVEAHGPEAEP